MPLTPFHIGPASLGFLFPKNVDVFAFLLGSVLPDIEPLAVILFFEGNPLHGILHSFLGAMIAAFFAASIMFRGRNVLNMVSKSLYLGEITSFNKLFFSALAGACFHVALDAPLYTDIAPLYPFGANPLFGIVSSGSILMLCAASFFVGIAAFFVNFLRNDSKKRI